MNNGKQVRIASLCILKQSEDISLNVINIEDSVEAEEWEEDANF